MNLTDSEKKLYLEGDDGLKPYLRLKGKGMPQNKISQIAWLLLNGDGCGFCKVCRDEPCNIKDGERCTDNIANYIRSIVLEEAEKEIRNKAIDDFAERVKDSRNYIFDDSFGYVIPVSEIDEIAEQLKDGGTDG